MVLALPAGKNCLAGRLRALLGRHVLGAFLPASPAELDGSGILGALDLDSDGRLGLRV
jgi:hypothetical protein